MALVTIQRSPSPSNSSESVSEESHDGLTDSDLSGSHSSNRSKRSKSGLKKLRKLFATIRFVNKLRFSENYFAVKGAALILPRSEWTNRRRPSQAHLGGGVGGGGDIHRHLQLMIHLLRPQDTIKVAVKLESMYDGRNRYLTVVSCTGRQDNEETVILGLDVGEDKATIGLIIPIWGNTKIKLDGDGGFLLTSTVRDYIFKPVSVQAMWSCLQSLNKLRAVAAENNYYPMGLTHTWVTYYEAHITSDQTCINEWNAMEDVESRLYNPEVDGPQQVEDRIKLKLKEIMMKVDLDEVTCKYLRNRMEEELNIKLDHMKQVIEEEMFFILRQMDASSKIFDYLYLGSEWNASNLEELQKNGIKYILNISREIDNFYPDLFEYCNVRLWDVATSELLKHWDKTYKFIKKAKHHHSKVLVHCRMGISRSASTVIAFAMKEYGWNLHDTLDYVQKRRNVVFPNPGFMKQLVTYQGILDASKQRHNTLWRSQSENDLTNQQMSLMQQETRDPSLDTMNFFNLDLISDVNLKTAGPRSWSPADEPAQIFMKASHFDLDSSDEDYNQEDKCSEYANIPMVTPQIHGNHIPLPFTYEQLEEYDVSSRSADSLDIDEAFQDGIPEDEGAFAVPVSFEKGPVVLLNHKEIGDSEPLAWSCSTAVYSDMSEESDFEEDLGRIKGFYDVAMLTGFEPEEPDAGFVPVREEDSYSVDLSEELKTLHPDMKLELALSDYKKKLRIAKLLWFQQKEDSEKTSQPEMIYPKVRETVPKQTQVAGAKLKPDDFWIKDIPPSPSPHENIDTDIPSNVDKKDLVLNLEGTCGTETDNSIPKDTALEPAVSDTADIKEKVKAEVSTSDTADTTEKVKNVVSPSGTADTKVKLKTFVSTSGPADTTEKFKAVLNTSDTADTKEEVKAVVSISDTADTTEKVNAKVSTSDKANTKGNVKAEVITGYTAYFKEIVKSEVSICNTDLTTEKVKASGGISDSCYTKEKVEAKVGTIDTADAKEEVKVVQCPEDKKPHFQNYISQMEVIIPGNLCEPVSSTDMIGTLSTSGDTNESSSGSVKCKEVGVWQHYEKEDIPWSAGTVKRTTQEMEEKQKDFSVKSVGDKVRTLSMGSSGTTESPSGSQEKLSIDLSDPRVGLTEGEVKASFNQSQYSGQSPTSSPRSVKSHSSERSLDSGATPGQASGQVTQRCTVYEMEDIPYEPASVQRIKEEIEKREKSSSFSDPEDSSGKSVQRSSSCRSESNSPKTSKFDRNSSRRRTVLPVVRSSPSRDVWTKSPAKQKSKVKDEQSSKSNQAAEKELEVKVVRIKEEAVALKEGQVQKHKKEFEERENGVPREAPQKTAVIEETVLIRTGSVKRQKEEIETKYGSSEICDITFKEEGSTDSVEESAKLSPSMGRSSDRKEESSKLCSPTLARPSHSKDCGNQFLPLVRPSENKEDSGKLSSALEIVLKRSPSLRRKLETDEVIACHSPEVPRDDGSPSPPRGKEGSAVVIQERKLKLGKSTSVPLMDKGQRDDKTGLSSSPKSRSKKTCSVVGSDEVVQGVERYEEEGIDWCVGTVKQQLQAMEQWSKDTDTPENKADNKAESPQKTETKTSGEEECGEGIQPVNVQVDSSLVDKTNEESSMKGQKEEEGGLSLVQKIRNELEDGQKSWEFKHRRLVDLEKFGHERTHSLGSKTEIQKEDPTARTGIGRSSSFKENSPTKSTSPKQALGKKSASRKDNSSRKSAGRQDGVGVVMETVIATHVPVVVTNSSAGVVSSSPTPMPLTATIATGELMEKEIVIIPKCEVPLKSESRTNSQVPKGSAVLPASNTQTKPSTDDQRIKPGCDKADEESSRLPRELASQNVPSTTCYQGDDLSVKDLLDKFETGSVGKKLGLVGQSDLSVDGVIPLTTAAGETVNKEPEKQDLGRKGGLEEKKGRTVGVSGGSSGQVVVSEGVEEAGVSTERRVGKKLHGKTHPLSKLAKQSP